MVAMVKQLVWRTGVAAAGLAVAVLVGSRLSSTITILVLVCAWLPLTAWCLFAPRIAAALPVALVLLAAIATIRWALPGQPGDRTLAVAWPVVLCYLLPGGLALLAVIWRSRSAAAHQRWLRVTAAAAAVILLGCGCAAVSWGRVGVPSPDELFPLPQGLDATRETGPDGENGCDQTGHSCWTYYRITGAPGESAAALTERLRRHLQTARGWNGPETCRPVHWFGRRTATDLCITVTSDPAATSDHPAIGVELSLSNLHRSP
jgi:hypothetical protein